MPADGYLNFNTRVDTDGFKKGVKDVESSTKGFGSALDNIGRKIKTAFTVTAIAAFGKAVIESAADVKAADSQFSQTFGNMADDASAAIKRVAGPADMLGTRLQGAATSIYAFAKTAKMDTSTAMTFMEDALTAAADSAAYYDRSIEDTTATLRSFLKGNYVNDAALGLSATEATRNAKAMEMYGKKFMDLSEAQKQLALLEMVKDANMLSGAMGQAAREAEGWENVTGNLSEAWNRLLAAIGKPVLKLAVPVVQQMTSALTQMTTWANNAYSALAKVFGWQEQQTAEADATAKAQDGITEAVKETAKAQKLSLASFDEIQTLAGEADGGENAGGGAGIAQNAVADTSMIADNVALSDTYQNLSAISKKLSEIKDIFLTGFWDSFVNADFSGVRRSFDSIATSIQRIFSDKKISNSASDMASAFSRAFGQISGSIASIGGTIAQNLTGGFANYLNGDSDTIQSAIKNIFDVSAGIAESVGNTWQAFSNIFSVFATEDGQTLTGNIIGIFANAGLGIAELGMQIGADFMSFITQSIIDNQEPLKNVLADVVGLFADTTGSVKSLVDDLVQGVLKLYNEHVAPLIDTLTKVVSEWVGAFTEAYEEHIKPVLTEFADEFKVLVEEKLKPMFDKIFEYFGKIYDITAWVWSTVLKPIGEWIINVLVRQFSEGFSAIKDVVFTVVSEISDLITNRFTALNGVVDFITGVFSGDWEKAWNGLVDIGKSMLNNLISALETGVNLIIIGINSLFGGFRAAVGTVGDALGFDWNIPEIPKITLPRLASGAVIPPNREFLAVLGDQKRGTNIEAPAELIKQMVNEALNEHGGMRRQITVPLILDGVEFGRAVVEYGEQEQFRKGKTLVMQ